MLYFSSIKADYSYISFPLSSYFPFSLIYFFLPFRFLQFLLKSMTAFKNAS